MSNNVPDWVANVLDQGYQQRIAKGKLIPGREQASLTIREQQFLQSQLLKEKDPLQAEAIVFSSLDKLNTTVGRR